MLNRLKSQIEKMYSDGDVDLEIIKEVLKLVRTGEVRAAEKKHGKWVANTWVKQAILLAFKYFKSTEQASDSFDKFGLLPYTGGYRKVPGAIIRDYVHISKDAVIMPSCVNIGAYIGTRTMIDMNSVIGSCAQIGNNCHISALACIGGVLEPAVATPTIIEDNCLVGAHSAVLEGVVVETGSVVAAGTILTSSTKIINRISGQVSYGLIPAGSVVVPGSYESQGCNINCAVIVKQVSSIEVSINGLLRHDISEV